MSVVWADAGSSGGARVAPNQVLIVWEDDAVPSQTRRGGQRARARATGPGVLSDEFVVTGEAADVFPQAGEALEAAGVGDVSVTFETVPDLALSVVSFDGEVDVGETVAAFSGLEGVRHTQPNFIYRHQQTAEEPSDDPLIGSLYNWIFDFLKLDEVYDLVPAAAKSRSADEQPVIAVIDGSPRASHPEFEGRLWSSDSCTDDFGFAVPGGCAQGGGLSADRSQTELAAGVYPLTANPELGFATHGTNVAGVALASFDNGKGATGVAQNSRLLALNTVADNRFPISLRFLSTVDIVRMLRVADRNVDTQQQPVVVNLSLGEKVDELDSCVDGPSVLGFDELLYNRIGAFPGVVVTASGNAAKRIGEFSGTLYAPADFTKTVTDTDGNVCWTELDNLITVGGVTRTQRPFSVGNYGPHLELLAPASGVLTTSFKVNYGKQAQSNSLFGGSAVQRVSSGAAWRHVSGDFEVPNADGRVIDETNFSDTAVSPPADELAEPSHYTIGPIDLSFVDSSRGETAGLFSFFYCKDEAEKFNISFSSDGSAPDAEYTSLRAGSFGGLLLGDDTAMSQLEFPINSNALDSRRLVDGIPSEHLTNDFHIRVGWTGSSAEDIPADECFAVPTVYISGPLRSDLTHEEELRRGYYSVASGTSFAAPAVAGSVATLLEVKPNLEPSEVQEILRDSASSLEEMEYSIGGLSVSHTDIAGGRLLNLKGALAELFERYPELSDRASVVLGADTGADGTDGVTNDVSAFGVTLPEGVTDGAVATEVFVYAAQTDAVSGEVSCAVPDTGNSGWTLYGSATGPGNSGAVLVTKDSTLTVADGAYCAAARYDPDGAGTAHEPSSFSLPVPFVYDTVAPVLSVAEPTQPAEHAFKLYSATDTDTASSVWHYIALPAADACDGTAGFSSAVAYVEGASVRVAGQSFNTKKLCFRSQDSAGNTGYAASAEISGLTADTSFDVTKNGSITSDDALILYYLTIGTSPNLLWPLVENGTTEERVALIEAVKEIVDNEDAFYDITQNGSVTSNDALILYYLTIGISPNLLWPLVESGTTEQRVELITTVRDEVLAFNE